VRDYSAASPPDSTKDETMTEQIDIRVTALTMAQEAAKQAENRPILALDYANTAEALHRLADIEDRLDFTEPANALMLNDSDLELVEQLATSYLIKNPYDGRVSGLRDRVKRAR